MPGKAREGQGRTGKALKVPPWPSGKDMLKGHVEKQTNWELNMKSQWNQRRPGRIWKAMDARESQGGPGKDSEGQGGPGRPGKARKAREGQVWTGRPGKAREGGGLIRSLRAL